MAFRTLFKGKGHRFFRNKSTQDLPGDLQNTANVSLSPATTTPQKKFKKTNDIRHDINVLAMTYILKDNPIIKELICLIIALRDQRDDNVCKTCKLYRSPTISTWRQLSEILNLSAKFTVKLISCHEKDSSKASTAITAFLAWVIVWQYYCTN